MEAAGLQNLAQTWVRFPDGVLKWDFGVSWCVTLV